MTAPLLAVRDVSAGYEGVPVIRNINLHVDAGEVVALLGPNGAGKSTTLRCVSGLLPLLDGSIDVLGEPVTSTRPNQNALRGLAHVPEKRSLFFDLTVAENLRLGMRANAARRKELKERVLDYLPALEALLDRKSGLLSGGEQQMLALARALVTEPKFLMVDEMSLGLAPVIVQQLLPIVRKVANETGAGILLVEQHVHLALEVCDRAYVINHGEVVLDAPASELRAQPELLEASYLGGAATS